MKLSAELVDLIFSFLVSHQKALLACSKIPELSQIVETPLSHHRPECLLPWPGSDTDPSSPNRISKFISENPHIPHYVRVLQIRVLFEHLNINNLDIMQDLENFAKTLLLSPVLECIKLTPNKCLCGWPGVFELHRKTASVFLPSRSYTLYETRISPVP